MAEPKLTFGMVESRGQMPTVQALPSARAIAQCVADRLGSRRESLMLIVSRVGIAISVIFGLMCAGPIEAQSSAAAAGSSPSFDVASIKLDHSEGNHVRLSFNSNSLVASSVTLRRLIEFAYNLNDSQLSGGPGWANSELYEIQAKIDDATAAALSKASIEQRQEQRRLMVQSLLAERFKLKVRQSSQELPIYALTLMKKGSTMSPSTNAVSGIYRSPGEARFTGISISVFADWLSDQLGRKVVDQTGLQGSYDFSLHWTEERQTPPPDSRGSGVLPGDSSGPSIFSALQEQLGLKLESKKGPVETLIIDSAEKPSAN